MAGSVGFSDGTGSGSSSVNITTDGSGNVTVTMSPNKDDGTPNTAVPPSTQLKGTGDFSGGTPAYPSETGTFIVHAGDPLYVKIECKTNCEVIISLYPNGDGTGAAIWSKSYGNQDKVQKQILLLLLRQAVIDARPKPKTDAPKTELPKTEIPVPKHP